MQLRRRLRLGVATVLAAVGLAALATGWTLLEFRTARGREELAGELTAASAALNELRDEYILRRSVRAHAQWQVTSAEFAALLDRARTAFRAPGDRALLDTVRGEEEVLVLLMAGLAVFRAAGPERPVPPAGLGEDRILSQLVARGYALRDALARLAVSARGATERAAARAVAALALALVATAAVTVGNAVAVGRTLTRRTETLLAGTRVIGSGDLGHRIQVEGNDELAELARAVNAMAERLRHSHTSIEKLTREAEERARAEAALRASEGRYRRLHESLADGFALVDMGGRIRDTNEAYRAMLGYDAAELARLTYEELTPAAWHEAEARIVREEVLVRGHSGVYEKEYRRRDGTVFPVELRTFLVREEDGSPLGMWAIVRDISERKAAERRHREDEERLRELSAGLERAVAERTAELRESREALMNLVDDLNARTAELRETNERLQGLDRLKSLFIASMSHELRTPLNSIIGFTGILLQGMAGPLTAEQRLQLGMVQNSSQHLLSLITDVIDLGKIESGRIDLERRPCDLAALAREVLDSFRVTAAKKGLALAAEGDGPVPLTSDPRRVRQVLVNLVGNAVKFTDAGAVTVAVSARGGRARVAVRDTGPGIPREEQWKLFQPFSRIVGGEFARHEGTGLGLYLSRKLADLLGGGIEVRSAPGRGSVFTFTLPADAGEETG